MKPIDMYKLGTLLARAAKTEVYHRTTVNRLYYGLHHEACCRFFRENPHEPLLGRLDRHKELTRKYKNLPKDSRTELTNLIGNLLNDLRWLRAQADYNLGQTTLYGRTLTSEELLRTTFTKSERLLQKLEEYSPGEAPDGCRCAT